MTAMTINLRVPDLTELKPRITVFGVGGAGATEAPYQPQEDVRVYLDPAGHPFCLWVRE